MTVPTTSRRPYRGGGARMAGIIPVEAGRPIRAVLATDAPVDGFALDPAGVDLARFKRNPVLMEAHDHLRTPLGRVENIEIETHRLTGELVFGRSTRAREARQDVLDGVISTVSIGFDIDRSTLDRWTGKVGKWTLAEVSLVSVPADVDAVIYERSKRSEASPVPLPQYPHAAVAAARRVGAPLLAAFDEYEIRTLLADIERTQRARLAEAQRDIVGRAEAALLHRAGLTVDQDRVDGFARGAVREHQHGSQDAAVRAAAALELAIVEAAARSKGVG